MASIHESEKHILNKSISEIRDQLEYIETLKERGNVVLQLIRISKEVDKMIDRLQQRY